MFTGIWFLVAIFSLFALGYGYFVLSQANKEYKASVKALGLSIAVIIIIVSLAGLVYSLYSLTFPLLLLRKEANIPKIITEAQTSSTSEVKAKPEKKEIKKKNYKKKYLRKKYNRRKK